MVLRNDFIIPFLKGKKVLDLGFLGENDKTNFSDLHKLVLKYSKKATGVDFHKKRIDKLKKEGYHVVCDDVMSLKKINEVYDVIICGELIERVENIGLFLDNLKKKINKNGIIIITTPNMFSFRYILRHVIFNQETPYWKNRKDEIMFGHIIGFSNMLLHNLFLRKDFQIINNYTIKNEYSGFKGNLEKIISKIFPRLSPSLIYVIKKNERDFNIKYRFWY